MASDEIRLAKQLHTTFISRGLTLAVAEAATGGRLGERLVRYSGASAYFKGSVVTYDYLSRTTALGIPQSLLSTYGSVSEQCAVAMAEAVRLKFNADFGIASTGAAGPSGSQIGTVWVAIADPTAVIARVFSINGSSRLQNQQGFTIAALRFLYETVAA